MPNSPSPEEMRRYGLALAALGKGVVTEPYTTTGWCATISSWRDKTAWGILLKAYTPFTEYPTQIDALAAAAEALRLEPVGLVPEGYVLVERMWLIKHATDVQMLMDGPMLPDEEHSSPKEVTDNGES